MTDARFLQEGFDSRLSHAVEECAEFIGAAMKLQRWGTSSVNPLLPESERETNLEWLKREMIDVRFTMDRLEAAIRLDLDPGFRMTEQQNG